MKIAGLSPNGCRVILPLAVVTLLLLDVAQHSFAPTRETVPFFVLIPLCALRLLWRKPLEP